MVGHHNAPEGSVSVPHPAIAKPDLPIAWRRRVVDAMLAAFAWAVRCRARSAQRRALAQLDDRLLRDVGLNRIDVAAECGKWFWLR
jgi:uncharacterized protein YjiS (DUF1127 family)